MSILYEKYHCNFIPFRHKDERYYVSLNGELFFSEHSLREEAEQVFTTLKSVVNENHPAWPADGDLRPGIVKVTPKGQEWLIALRSTVFESNK